jgi:hypothetical protein
LVLVKNLTRKINNSIKENVFNHVVHHNNVSCLCGANKQTNSRLPSFLLILIGLASHENWEQSTKIKQKKEFTFQSKLCCRIRTLVSWPTTAKMLAIPVWCRD